MARRTASPVEAYIAKQRPESQAVLRRVTRLIRRMLPDAEETISYQIPTYKIDGRYVVYVAGWKEHWSLYPVTDSVREALGAELNAYELKKGTIRFPVAEPVPMPIVERIVRQLAKAAELRAQAKAGSPGRRKVGHRRTRG